ncbi:MAG: SMP-30/gluconolactonase/LRE family protein [Proteobacteria bacterium]|nr:SMP-30/gluconolactonase/LRE family protein [Pseudomonadota bacterium]
MSSAYSEPECVWPLGALLGEGPIWVPSDGALWFVDIKKNHIHRFDPATGSTRTVDAPESPGFLVPDGDGRFTVGLASGLYRLDPASGAFSLLHRVDADKPGNRINDGARDPHGRLWFGTMDNGESEPTGSLYRLDADGPHAVDSGICITNGPCFSPDGRTLYHTDTRNRTIYAFDLAPDGTLSNKRVWVTIEEGVGFPDGSVTDSEGCVWVGLYAGWAARRYSPEGRLISTVRFPCANITKLAFAGPDRKTVYATTASKGLDDKARAEQPLAGGLFRFHSDIPGLA